MATNLIELPETLGDSASVLIEGFGNGFKDKRLAARACVHVIAYGTGKAIPAIVPAQAETTKMASCPPCLPCTDEQAVACLQKIQACESKGFAAAIEDKAQALDLSGWKGLILKLAKLLPLLLSVA